MRCRKAGRERKRQEQEDDRVVWWFQQRFFSFSLSPGDHPMLSSLSFKRGRLCQSSQIRKTGVAERLYLAWVWRKALWEVKIGEGQLSHFVSQVGAFHAVLETWRGGPT